MEEIQNSEVKRSLQWHILWSPLGFGNTTAKLVELWEAVKQDNTDVKPEMYFPTYMDKLKEKDIQVPLFSHYVFLKCIWHRGLEDRVRELSGVSAVFLRPVGGLEPHIVTDDEMERVREALQNQVAMVKEVWHMDDLVVGDSVMIKSMRIIGQVLYFMPPNRAMVSTMLFSRETPTPCRLNDLERV